MTSDGYAVTVTLFSVAYFLFEVRSQVLRIEVLQC
jgi:hypothetical protein